LITNNVDQEKIMNIYSIALFIHILGALGFFIALGVEWISLRHLRRATHVEQVQEWLRISNEMVRFGMIAMLLLLAAGIYMMAIVWGGVAWIIIALGSLIPMSVLAMAVTRPRMTAIKQYADAEHGTISPIFHQLLHHPLLWISMQTRVAIALGIVFLMTVKPSLGGSLLTMSLAIILSIASSLPILRRVSAGRASNITWQM
jgi:hypothetical protein